MTRLLVVGPRGLLGQEVASKARQRGYDVVELARPGFDATDPESVARIATGAYGSGGVLVNCAAYTAVDRAESEPQAATELNTLAPGYLAQACAMSGLRMLHISTDFVFDGHASTPYVEDDPVHPLGVYGATKLGGEESVRGALPTAWIVRTSWLYGPGGACFPRSILDAWRSGKSLRVVADQVGCPTYAPALAQTLLDLIEGDVFPGTYHSTGSEPMSWHEFATRVVAAYAKVQGIEPPVVAAIPSTEWPTPARRPSYSVLSNEKLRQAGIAPMPPVSASIEDFVARYASRQAP